MTGSLQPAISSPSFVQQFMQFPRQSIPRTLLYSAVTNVAFYQLASTFTRFVENKVGEDKKAISGIFVFGGLTALFNAAQLKLFDFQLSRVVTLAIAVVITVAMTLVYFLLNHRSFPVKPPHSRGEPINPPVLDYKTLSEGIRRSLFDRGFKWIDYCLNNILILSGIKTRENRGAPWECDEEQQYCLLILINEFLMQFDQLQLNPSLKLDTDEKKCNFIGWLVDCVHTKREEFAGMGVELNPLTCYASIQLKLQTILREPEQIRDWIENDAPVYRLGC